MKVIKAKIITPPDDSIADAKKVRAIVFQEEQGIGVELDFDGKDASATHIVIYHDEIPVGTGRIRKIDTETVKIERVAVVSEMRGKGLGKLIMQTIDDHLTANKPVKATMDAQLHAKGFYEGLGYEQVGEVFEEVGIPHVVMVKHFIK